MNINKAIEIAAAPAADPYLNGADLEDILRAALGAVGPWIGAQVLRDTAERYRGKAKSLSELPGLEKTSFHMSISTLLDLADELDRTADEMEAGR